MSSGISLHLDRSAEFLIDARVRVVMAEPVGPFVRLSATFGGITSTQTGAQAMAYTLPADKMIGLQIAYVDANGNPATVDGAVEWESSNPDIAAVLPTSADGSTADLVPGSQVGQCQITARADADLGSGIRELVTLLDVTVVGGEAVAGTITPVGDPQPKP